MGVFIISPVDKGGQLWRPSRTFASICESGGLSPIAFNNLWIWAHKTATGDHAIHTLSVGAARPSDFDEHVESAKMLNKAAELTRPVDTKYAMVTFCTFKTHCAVLGCKN
jgi:predicted aldo/keto reductase-like oxidoreductase